MEKMDVDDDTVMDLSASRPSRRETIVDGTLDLSKPSVEPRSNAPVVVPLPLTLPLPLQLSGLPLTVQAVNSPRSGTSSPSLAAASTASVTPTAAPIIAPPSEPGTMEPPASRSLLRRDLDSQYPRRSLRPRQEPRSYVEAPDVIVLSDEEPKINGYANGYESDSSDPGEMPPLLPIKELSPAEVEERERMLRKLREELRNEEMKLVLLKKLKQSQQMKENIAVTPSVAASTVPPPAGTKVLPGMVKPTTSGHTSAPTTERHPTAAHAHSLSNTTQAHVAMRSQNHHKQPLASPNVPLPVNRAPPPRSSLPPPLIGGRTASTPILPPNTTLTPTNVPRNNVNNHVGRAGTVGGVSYAVNDRSSKEHHAPATAVTPQPQDRSRGDDNQTPAQRQAAAKLALRKQLEKTLLQIPPPKPPPPEMHFIPNPSNTEFIYLLGLEHVVDYITKDNKTPPAPEPFRCSQCSTNFTPVWKWEKSSTKGKEPKVICESCVTTNVKKALKAEHTNRLKTAFVKALQQEQEIEQRLAQSNSASPQPEPHHPPPPPPPPHVPSPAPKPVTPTLPPAPRHVPTPPSSNSAPSRTPPLSKLAQENSKFNSHQQQAAAAAALQQQLLRGIGGMGGLSQHQLSAQMLQFTLYQYQLAMAQAASASSGKGAVAAAATAANLVELQRQAETLQRQYLMDMIPPPAPSPSSRHSNHHNAHNMNNWKT